jgi:hypothetical protein
MAWFYVKTMWFSQICSELRVFSEKSTKTVHKGAQSIFNGVICNYLSVVYNLTSSSESQYILVIPSLFKKNQERQKDVRRRVNI